MILVLNVFTFHYGPIQITRLDRPCLFKQIYIPLWSYSNDIATRIIPVAYKFTFHYGPIQIGGTQFIESLSALFTFHYGPIQISLSFISIMS